jgi:hypothetical protein
MCPNCGYAVLDPGFSWPIAVFLLNKIKGGINFPLKRVALVKRCRILIFDSVAKCAAIPFAANRDLCALNHRCSWLAAFTVLEI